MLNNSTILITGGTGSFGKFFTKYILENFNPKRLIIFSRDEMKQWDMARSYIDDSRIRFFIGDVRDKDRLNMALRGVDYIIHAAATKIVPIAEYNPFECVKTNVIGAMNVIDTAIQNKVKKVIALSTDKASSPINLYGATKLASDKLFIAGNSYSGSIGTIFSVVRYGNVMGSRGSVIPLFMDSVANQRNLYITDPRMTRFMIDLSDAVSLVVHALEDSLGGEIYVKKIPSMNIMDILAAIDDNTKYDVSGIRPGEKIHEQMIGVEDSAYTYEYSQFYKILPAIHDWYKDKNRIKDGVKVKSDFSYTSDNNNSWMSTQELKTWIKNNKNILGMI